MRVWYGFIAWLARNALFRPLGGFSVTGRENVPMEGPVIIAPVHVSYLDPMLVGCTAPREISYMAKQELFRNPLLAALIRSLNTFPVRRGENDSAAIREALRLLQSGRALLVFPEGTRGDGETLGQVQAGLMMMAKRTGAPIVPIGLYGTHKAWPRGEKKMRRHRMAVRYGQPFRLEELGPKPSREDFTAALEGRLLAASAEAGLKLRTPDRPGRPAGSDRPERSLEPPGPETD
jgi:1-acyl-sn-glycerol-3-phosphate acyltransferase